MLGRHSTTPSVEIEHRTSCLKLDDDNSSNGWLYCSLNFMCCPHSEELIELLAVNLGDHTIRRDFVALADFEKRSSSMPKDISTCV